MYVTLTDIQYYFPKLENFDSLPIVFPYPERTMSCFVST
jgi:hypothetical protein